MFCSARSSSLGPKPFAGFPNQLIFQLTISSVFSAGMVLPFTSTANNSELSAIKNILPLSETLGVFWL